MVESRLKVWARNPDRGRRGELTVIEAAAVLRDTEVGTWSMTVEGDDEVAARFDEGWGVVVYETDEAGVGRFMFSGPADTIDRELTAHGTDLVISGVTDDHALADRLVLPSPSASAEQQTAAAYYSYKGLAEDLIVKLINEQAGPGARVEWQTPGLQAAISQGRGGASSVHARLTRLLDEVRTIALTSGLVVDVGQRGAGPALTVGIRGRVDRRRAVRFRPELGLAKATAGVKAPAANVVLVAGGGEGTARVIRQYTGAVAGWGGRKIAVLQDRRDTTDLDEIAKAGAETLAAQAASAHATFDVTETDDHVLGRDYMLGDTVTVDLGAWQLSEPVRAAEIRWSADSRTVNLTVGDPRAENEETTPAIYRQVRELAQAVHELKVRR